MAHKNNIHCIHTTAFRRSMDLVTLEDSDGEDAYWQNWAVEVCRDTREPTCNRLLVRLMPNKDENKMAVLIVPGFTSNDLMKYQNIKVLMKFTLMLR